MKEDAQKLTMAIIAGASAALDFKDKNPNAFNPEVIQHVTQKANEIIGRIDDPE